LPSFIKMWSGRLALAGQQVIPVVYQIQVSAIVLVEPLFSPWKIVFKQYSFNLISQGLHHHLGSFWPSSTCFTRMLCSHHSFVWC